MNGNMLYGKRMRGKMINGRKIYKAVQGENRADGDGGLKV